MPAHEMANQVFRYACSSVERNCFDSVRCRSLKEDMAKILNDKKATIVARFSNKLISTIQPCVKNLERAVLQLLDEERPILSFTSSEGLSSWRYGHSSTATWVYK